MSNRVDPNLLLELKEYGAVNTEACFNCGTCTAMCPLTSDAHPFPRNMIRLTQLGLKDRLLQSTDPWLCYYCGDCTTTCPRGAEPAETMMATRRWLTAQYDRTGRAAKLYTKETAVLSTIIRMSLLTLVLLIIYHAVTGFDNIITDRVVLNAFAPVMWVWAFVLLHFAYLGYHVLSSSLFMVKQVMQSTVEKYGQIPLSVYAQEFKTFITHYFTQKRWRDCDDAQAETRWRKHLFLVSGYVIMLALIVVFLWWFQTDKIYPIYHPQRWLGYYATVALAYASIEMLVGRRRKKEQLHRFSHPSDWLFPTFLLTGAITGILVHIFRYAGWAWPTYIIYVIHVMAMVAMLDTEVGVGKWTHMIYRPLAIYLETVKERVEQEQIAPDLVPAGTD
ncbi:MAG: 4Fe-4S dicluster domain-containing protein [Ardenticatenaceae bacterium]|nr:4Fe-4S dicluster domain-containing protein [Ardenticatenaceae bacterium]